VDSDVDNGAEADAGADADVETETVTVAGGGGGFFDGLTHEANSDEAAPDAGLTNV
jgi:hypothetical protein